MNKKIKKLAIKAGLSEMPSNYPDMADLYKGADFELERFAELIIKECAELTLDYKNEQHYWGWLDYRDAIKEHFGVE
jgi:hypothetical protein